jgi:hypothetical protein
VSCRKLGLRFKNWRLLYACHGGIGVFYGSGGKPMCLRPFVERWHEECCIGLRALECCDAGAVADVVEIDVRADLRRI